MSSRGLAGPVELTSRSNVENNVSLVRSQSRMLLVFRRQIPTFFKEHLIMLQLAITCLIIALIAAVLGFGGIAGSFVGVAKILFFVFLVIAVLSFLGGGFRSAPSGPDARSARQSTVERCRIKTSPLPEWIFRPVVLRVRPEERRRIEGKGPDPTAGNATGQRPRGRRGS